MGANHHELEHLAEHIEGKEDEIKAKEEAIRVAKTTLLQPEQDELTRLNRIVEAAKVAGEKTI